MRVNGNTIEFRPGPYSGEIGNFAGPDGWRHIEIPPAIFDELRAAFLPKAAKERNIEAVFDLDHPIVAFRERGRCPDVAVYGTARGGVDIALPGSRIPECFKEAS